MGNTAVKALSALTGQSFHDGDGQRWWVRGPRPGPEGQLVIEAEVKGRYPRVDLYVMTEKEFRAKAQEKHLTPDRPR